MIYVKTFCVMIQSSQARDNYLDAVLVVHVDACPGTHRLEGDLKEFRLKFKCYNFNYLRIKLSKNFVWNLNVTLSNYSWDFESSKKKN